MKRVHITTGDLDGIGLEVALKALKELTNLPAQFVLWRRAGRPLPSFLSEGGRKIITLSEPSYLGDLKITKRVLVDMACSLSPTQWAVEAAKHCAADPLNQVLTTGPLSKTQIKKDGFTAKGHTQILKKISKAPEVFMVFLGKHFNTALLTGHVPLKKVRVQPDKLDACLRLCARLKKHAFAAGNKKTAVLGLNPHAGEEGLLGAEEQSLQLCFKKWRRRHVKGPLTPDTAFMKTNWRRFFIYVCMYHDQALIPFKMIHGRDSLQLSLGLPFVRTSVSHGTAKDIFGKNKACALSMKKAVMWAVKNKPV